MSSDGDARLDANGNVVDAGMRRAVDVVEEASVADSDIDMRPRPQPMRGHDEAVGILADAP